jgi:hypothetical protein
MWDSPGADYRTEMIMKKQQFAWILGGAWLVGMGGIAAMSACSGDDSTVKDSGTKDNSVSDTGGNKDTSTQDQNSGDSSNPQDAGADCKTVTAPFTTDAGPFCPFQGDGSTFAACDNTQHCCLPASGNSVCNPLATACAFANDASTNSDFVCNETNDCPSGSICCDNGEINPPDPGCGYDFVSKQKGTSCVVGTTCPTGQGQICGGNADCPTGKTCFPVNTKAMWLGVCQSADGGI